MANRIGRYCGVAPDVVRADITMGFCDAIWKLNNDPYGLQEWEIESLLKLEHDAATVLHDWRTALSPEQPLHC